MALEVENLIDNAGDIRDVGLIPGLGRSPRGGLGNPVNCPVNPVDWGAWKSMVHAVAKKQTRLKRLTLYTQGQKRGEVRRFSEWCLQVTRPSGERCPGWRAGRSLLLTYPSLLQCPSLTYDTSHPVRSCWLLTASESYIVSEKAGPAFVSPAAAQRTWDSPKSWQRPTRPCQCGHPIPQPLSDLAPACHCPSLILIMLHFNSFLKVWVHCCLRVYCFRALLSHKYLQGWLAVSLFIGLFVKCHSFQKAISDYPLKRKGTIYLQEVY